MVEGIAQMQRRLLKVVPESVRAAVRGVLEQSAEEIVATAKSLVPVKTGRLRDSIGWTWGDAPKNSLTLGTVRAAAEGTLRITIYAGNDAAPYARWVEFGHEAHASSATGSGAAPHPFFYPAYRLNKKKAKARATRAVSKALKEAATR
jgi:HK97 gp10 family phage protein